MRERGWVDGLLRRTVRLLALVAIFAGAARADIKPITGDHRLLHGFIEDGAIVEEGWLEFVTSYEDYQDGGRDLGGGAVLAFRFGRDVEAGLVTGVLDRRREAGATLFGSVLGERLDGVGLADPLLYGKYRIVRSPFDLAVGAAVRFPLANEADGRGPGAFQYAAFAGLRKSFSRATLIWSLGVADREDARSPGGAAGKKSLRLTAGLLVPVSLVWMVILEAGYEGIRYEGEEETARALLGLDWRPTRQIAVRGGLGSGLSGTTAELSASLSFVLHF